MKVAVIYNKHQIDATDVINVFGMPTKERYNPGAVERIATALEHGGHNVRIVEGNKEVVEELGRFMPRVMTGERPGMVFNMAYGIQGQSRYTHIPAMLEMLGIPYVGSGPAAHGIALDKVMTKMVLQQHGLPTPRFWVFSSPQQSFPDLSFPVIVKPKMEAVSMGMRVVHEETELREAVAEVIEQYQQQALVEEFISGREFAVGLLGNYPDIEVLPIVEFDFEGNPDRIQSYSEKMEAPLDKICPAILTSETAEELQRCAREAFHALNIFDFARVDFRMDGEGHIHILELNSMASLGRTGSYVHAAKTAGYTYETLVNRMLDIAAMRYFGETTVEPVALERARQSSSLAVRVRTHVRSNLVTMEDYLRRMMEIPTYVHNTEGVNALGNWLSGRLKQLGFACQTHPQIEVGNALYFTNHQEKQNDVLILAHLDTFYGYQDHIPLREEDGRLYGSGVAESKGGLAVLLGALRALRFARRLRRVRCAILLTTDDSLGGRFCQLLVEEKARISRHVVGLKCGEEGGGIVTSCSGLAHYQIDIANVKGQAHAPDVIGALCQKILAWQKLSTPKEGTSVEITSLEGRPLYGSPPDHAAASLVIRFKEVEQGEKLDREIRRIARRNARNLRIHVARGVHRLPDSETALIRTFFERVERQANRIDVRVQAVHRPISSDICFVSDDVPALDGFGPVGGNYRSLGEYIVRDSLIDRASLLALAIRDCARDRE